MRTYLITQQIKCAGHIPLFYLKTKARVILRFAE